MNKLITTISIIGALGASSSSFAEISNVSTDQTRQDIFPASVAEFASKLGVELKEAKKEEENSLSKERVKSQEEKDIIDLLKIDYENAKSKIKYDYIFGLFLDFSKGNISINELEDEVGKRAGISSDKEREVTKKDEDKVEKLVAVATREVWEKYEKVISTDKKRLDNKEISIGDLQRDYGDLAIKWFSGQYGIKGEFVDKESNMLIPYRAAELVEEINKMEISTDPIAAPIGGLAWQNEEQLKKTKQNNK
jgi:hypothetical protein